MNDETRRPIPVVASRITTRRIGDEAFLMNLETLDTFALNDTAASVWMLIDGHRSETDIAVKLMSEYDVDKSECAAAVQRLLEEFAGSGLIRYDNQV